MNKNYLCKCGHEQDKHMVITGSCWGCFGDYMDENFPKPKKEKDNKTCCRSFKLDNLKYLEQRYNEKILEQYKVTKEI